MAVNLRGGTLLVPHMDEEMIHIFSGGTHVLPNNDHLNRIARSAVPVGVRYRENVEEELRYQDPSRAKKCGEEVLN